MEVGLELCIDVRSELSRLLHTRRLFQGKLRTCMRKLRDKHVNWCGNSAEQIEGLGRYFNV